MSSYDKVYALGCFTRQDVVSMMGSEKAADALIYAKKRNGEVRSVKRNLYVAISRETRQPVVSPYEIGSKITPSAFISHHSAFEYYGMANQVFSEIHVSSKTRFKDFEFDGRTYTCVHAKSGVGVESPRPRLRITGIERTIVDSIKDFTRIGGLEELLRCLQMVTYVSEPKMLEALASHNNQFLFQKTGYILSHYRTEMKLTDAFFSECEGRVRRSTRYFYPGIQFEGPKFDAKWRLFVPENLMKIVDEGGDAVV